MSITSWIRLEPRPRSMSMADSLQARIHDPLWLLGRQWQFGEFEGEDAGSPVAVKLRADLQTLDSSITMLDPETGKCIPIPAPLETIVEQEATELPKAEQEGETSYNFRMAAEAGMHFLRMLGSALAHEYRSAFLKAYPIQPAPEIVTRLDSAGARFLRIISGRAIDGFKLYNALKTSLPNDKLPENLNIHNPHKDAITCAKAWLSWFEAQCGITQSRSAWVKDRLEYATSIDATAASGGRTVLEAAEYPGGRLDWHSFNIKSQPAIKNATELPESFRPTPIYFSGMPSSRLWEFEEGWVNLGNIDAAPDDLLRLLFIEFMLVYGNDFFVIPIQQQVGTLLRIQSLDVGDTFAPFTSAINVPAASRSDGNGKQWRMFSLSMSSSGSQSSDAFFLPPVLGQVLESQPIEDVHFLRDEMANLVWAVEHLVETPAGGALQRFEALQEQQQTQQKAGDALVYRLCTRVPKYWIPFFTTEAGGALRMDEGAESVIMSRILGDLASLAEPAIPEEEIPRAGIHVTRSYQYARWLDGSTHLWIGRRKRPGRGEGSSGLRFDSIEME